MLSLRELAAQDHQALVQTRLHRAQRTANQVRDLLKGVQSRPQTIDLLAMLQDKTRNNTTMEEQRLVDNALTELRFRFVQAMENREKKAAAAGETPSQETEPKSEEQAGS